MVLKRLTLLWFLSWTFAFALPAQWPASNLVAFPDKGQELMLAAVGEARNTLDLVMYQLSDPKMIDALIAAHERGVKIRIIKEQQVYHHDNNRKDSDVSELSKLEQAEIPIKGLPTHFLTKNPKAQAHHKVLIIDQAYAIVTSANWDESTFAHARDFAFALTRDNDAPAFQEVLAVFEADWAEQPITPKVKSLIWGPEGQRQKLARLIQEAKSSIWIYQQSFNDPELVKLLVNKAKQGVRVHLLMMPFPFAGDVDRNNPFQEQLIAAGGQVRFYLDLYMHAKAVIIDGKKAYVGSCNFYPSSIDFNRELGWVTENPALINALGTLIGQDWSAAKNYQEAKHVKRDWNA